MNEIVLIEMPFSDIRMPSLGLTRLKHVIEKENPTLQVQLLYLSHTFADYFGINLYQQVALNTRHLMAGLGDWIFREVAFPEAPDNTVEYLERYYPSINAADQTIQADVLEKRKGLQRLIDDIVEKHRLDKAAIVGFTSFFSQNSACFALARNIKKVNPEVAIVMGGANCEYPMGEEIVNNVDSIDYVFSGPALVNFPAFVRLHLEGAPDSARNLQGVFMKSDLRIQNDAPVAFKQAAGITPLGESLDINTPIPLEYDSFIESYMRLTGEALVPRLPFETSRGCWWGEKSHCTFCGLNSSSMSSRAMAPSRAIQEFRALFSYLSRCSELFCVDNILPKSYLHDVFPYLDTPRGLSIFYEVKSDLSEVDLRTLSRAGVTCVQPGIEALNTSTLKLMKKGSTSFQNIALLKNCLLNNITPMWNLLVGFPGEKEEVYQKYCDDLPLLVHLHPPTGVYPIRFDRYSPYFDHAVDYNLDLHFCDFYGMIYPFSEASLSNLAYYFVDRNFEAPYRVQLQKWIQSLQKSVECWKTAWRTDGRQRPRLEFRPGCNQQIILDSRSGALIEHHVTENSARLLQRLNSPATCDRLLAEVELTAKFDVETEIEQLKNSGFVFQEGDRLLNLVMPGA
jgi:magnesium-protoporphyrin IX monomethyl ester (oxidative) cyclase